MANNNIVLTPTLLALTLMFAACSNEDSDSTPPATTTVTTPKPIIELPEIAIVGEPKKKEPPKANIVVATEEEPPQTVEKEEPPQVVEKAEAPKRVPVAGAEFQHSFIAENGERRTVDIDADKLVVLKAPDGTNALALTVAFAKQFDINNPEMMASLSPANRALIENAGNNMSTRGTEVGLMVNHVMTAHGVPEDAMKAAYNACKKYFPELSQ